MNRGQIAVQTSAECGTERGNHASPSLQDVRYFHFRNQRDPLCFPQTRPAKRPELTKAGEYPDPRRIGLASSIGQSETEDLFCEKRRHFTEMVVSCPCSPGFFSLRAEPGRSLRENCVIASSNRSSHCGWFESLDRQHRRLTNVYISVDELQSQGARQVMIMTMLQDEACREALVMCRHGFVFCIAT